MEGYNDRLVPNNNRKNNIPNLNMGMDDKLQD